MSDRTGRPAPVLPAPKPQRVRAMVGSARVVRADVTANLRPTQTEWQADCWHYYDEIGEYRFGTQWYGNVLSKVRLVAAMPPKQPGDAPTLITEGPARDFVEQFCGGMLGQAQMMAALGVQLIVPGIGWLVGQEVAGSQVWSVLSSDELRSDGQQWLVQTEGEWNAIPAAIVIRVWRPHRRWSWMPDSPSKPLRSTLRQVELLSEHVDATAISRLAGAGILVVPSEAEFPKEDPEADDAEELLSALVKQASTAIKDRSSAAAVVPMLLRIPGEFADKVQHITTSTPFDDRVLDLRENALRRIALGLDVPPEIVLGMGDVNHWSAWQISESALSLHVEPLAEVIIGAITENYLRPLVEEAGEQEDAIVWMDTSDLRTRPDRSADSITLYDRQELAGHAMRRETGFNEADAPSDDERKEMMAWKLALASPQLAPFLLPYLGLEIEGLTEPLPQDGPFQPPGTPKAQPSEPGTPPRPEEEPQETPEEIAASASIIAALLAACDQMVVRALERADSRLRNAVSRKDGTRQASVCEGLPPRRCVSDVSEYAAFDHLLEGAWAQVPLVATRYGIDPDALESVLDAYCRSLLASGIEHDFDRLTSVLLDGARAHQRRLNSPLLNAAGA